MRVDSAHRPVMRRRRDEQSPAGGWNWASDRAPLQLADRPPVRRTRSGYTTFITALATTQHLEVDKPTENGKQH